MINQSDIEFQELKIRTLLGNVPDTSNLLTNCEKFTDEIKEIGNSWVTSTSANYLKELVELRNDLEEELNKIVTIIGEIKSMNVSDTERVYRSKTSRVYE